LKSKNNDLEIWCY